MATLMGFKTTLGYLFNAFVTESEKNLLNGEHALHYSQAIFEAKCKELGIEIPAGEDALMEIVIGGYDVSQGTLYRDLEEQDKDVEVASSLDTESKSTLLLTPKDETTDETSDDLKKSWTVAKVKFLIQLYAMHKDQFSNDRIKKKNVWEKVTKALNAIGGQQFSSVEVDKKWRGLKERYRKIKAAKQTGNYYTTWQYFRDLQSIFEEEAESAPPCIITAVSSVSVDTDTGKTADAEFPSSQAAESETPMLLLSCETMDDSISMEKNWSRAKVKQLIQLYTTNEEQFCNKNIKEKDLWQVVADALNATGGEQFLPEEVDRKWRELSLRYKKLKVSKKEISCWSFFHDMQSVLEKHSPVKPSDVDAGALSCSVKTDETSETEQTVDVAVPSDSANLESSSLAPPSDETGDTTKTWWSVAKVLQLIKLYQKYKEEFCFDSVCKTNTWGKVAKALNATGGQSYTQEEVSKKWKSLQDRYMITKNSDKVASKQKSEWPFMKAMQSALEEDTALNSLCGVTQAATPRVETAPSLPVVVVVTSSPALGTQSGPQVDATEETANKKFWTTAKVKHLIQLYKQLEDEFCNKAVLKKDMWQKLTDILNAAGGQQFHSEEVYRKWRRLKEIYKKQLAKWKNGGRVGSYWPHMAAMHSILGAGPVIKSKCSSTTQPSLSSATGQNVDVAVPSSQDTELTSTLLGFTYDETVDDLKKIWTTAKVKRLIQLYDQHKDEFSNKTILKKDTWQKLTNILNATGGQQFYPEEVDKKWRGLKEQYRKKLAKWKNSGKSSWPYMAAIHSILETDPVEMFRCRVTTQKSVSLATAEATTNIAVPHSLSLDSSSSNLTTSASEDSADEERQKEDVAAPSSQDMDLTSTLVASAYDESADDPQKRWPVAKIKHLIQIHKRYEQEFSTAAIKKDIWKEVANALNAAGGVQFTAEQASTKWRILKHRYKKFKASKLTGRRLFSRPCMRDVLPILDDDPAHPPVIEEAEDSESASLSPTNEIQAFSWWTTAKVKLLIQLYKMHERQLCNSKYKRRRETWQKITDVLNATGGQQFSVDQVESKWRTLTDRYKKIMSTNKDTSKKKSTWPFAEDLQSIFENSSLVKPSCAITGDLSVIVETSQAADVIASSSLEVDAESTSALSSLDEIPAEALADKKRKDWSRAKILHLTQLYEQHRKEFNNQLITKKSVWKKITEALNATGGVQFRFEEVNKKWRGLKERYFRIKKAGRPSEWKYLDVMKPILEKKETVDPPPWLATATSLFSVDSEEVDSPPSSSVPASSSPGPSQTQRSHKRKAEDVPAWAQQFILGATQEQKKMRRELKALAKEEKRRNDLFEKFLETLNK